MARTAPIGRGGMDPVRAGILTWMAIRDAQRTSRAWVRLLKDLPIGVRVLRSAETRLKKDAPRASS